MKKTKYFDNLNGYLIRAEELLNKSDNVSISYCALELRKAIELIIWSQFKSAFQNIISYKSRFRYYDFIFGTQSQSISKMYDLLKKYSPNYVQHAKDKYVRVFLESIGNAPLKEVGKFCFIPGELPNIDYRYLSEIKHYEKEFLPPNNKIDINRLRDIYEKLIFIRDNYTIQLIPTESGKDQDIIKDIITKFNLKSGGY